MACPDSAIIELPTAIHTMPTSCGIDHGQTAAHEHTPPNSPVHLSHLSLVSVMIVWIVRLKPGDVVARCGESSAAEIVVA